MSQIEPIAEPAEVPAFQIIEGDCLEVMRALAPLKVDHVITDPPYSAHVKRNQPGKHGKARDGHTRLRDLSYEAITKKGIRETGVEIARIAKRWSIVFCDVESAMLWSDGLERGGHRHTRIGAWIRIGAAPQISGDRPAVGFDAITICHSFQKRRWNRGGHPGVWHCPIVHHTKREGLEHDTPKPIQLMMDLVTAFTDPGEVILDPFAGSGATLVAAIRLGRRVIGIEKDPKWAALCRERCEAEAAQSTVIARRQKQLGLFEKAPA